jgi:BirA family transcriptional regulator, biotin operon repressor / biotin---[acetyl-CoA-carboxylase] ligase
VNDASWSAAADPSRRIGRTVEFYAEIGSTNDRAREALDSGVGDGLAVVADLQTAGRGRRGRTWSSPAGVNLMVSVTARPKLEAGDVGLLGLAAALGVLVACADAVPDTEMRIRWPNDVVGPDGRKLAGLLVETAVEDDRLAEAVIGIGINVNWPVADMPAEVRDRATSLLELAGSPIDRVALLSTVLDCLDSEIGYLEVGMSPVERVAASSDLDGRRVTVDLGSAQLEGTAVGVSANGLLLLDTDAGRVALAVGEVVSVRDAPHPATSGLGTSA